MKNTVTFRTPTGHKTYEILGKKLEKGDQFINVNLRKAYREFINNNYNVFTCNHEVLTQSDYIVIVKQQ